MTIDTQFRQVIRSCAHLRRKSRETDTWITPEMIEAYCRLYQLGAAHSVETWHDEDLVGGLYGVALGRAFFGESMFSTLTDSSKVAFVYLIRQLKQWGYQLIDCQMRSDHLLSLGAREINRQEFLGRLDDALMHPDQLGRWAFDPDLAVI